MKVKFVFRVDMLDKFFSDNENAFTNFTYGKVYNVVNISKLFHESSSDVISVIDDYGKLEQGLLMQVGNDFWFEDVTSLERERIIDIILQ
jgi:hypothetical protein